MLSSMEKGFADIIKINDLEMGRLYEPLKAEKLSQLQSERKFDNRRKGREM